VGLVLVVVNCSGRRSPGNLSKCSSLSEKCRQDGGLKAGEVSSHDVLEEDRQTACCHLEKVSTPEFYE
jgi:hypothetical protein